MRLTRCLLRWSNKTKHYEYLWRTRAKKRKLELRLPAFLIEKGIEVKEPPSLRELPYETFVPPAGDPRFWTEPQIEERKNYHEETAFTYHQGVRLLEGLKQAQNFTKTVVYEGLPPAVERLVDKVRVPDQDLLIQQYIMQSQVWDTANSKLPRRIDKSNVGWKFKAEYGIPHSVAVKILTDNFVRLCHTAICSKYLSALQDRRLIYNPGLQTYLPYNGKNVIFKSTFNYLVSSYKPLEPFTSASAVSESVHLEIPSMYPVLPTIDMAQSHVYSLEDNTGFLGDYKYDQPHTFVFANQNKWKNRDRQAQALLFSFAYAVVQAKAKYGVNVKTLPEPMAIQCVNIGESNVNIVCFQLNTTDIDCDGGVKNFAWLDTGNRLFKKHLPTPWKGRSQEYRTTKRDSFNSTPFRKMMAVMLNGVALEK